MRKIAILACLKANDVCTGEACLHAYRERSGAFLRYAGEDTELAAFLRCNGCQSCPENDPGMLEKLDRLQTLGVSALHLGVCAAPGGRECPNIARIAAMAEKRGMKIVRGTHEASL
jgi:predicted metal-binding protein